MSTIAEQVSEMFGDDGQRWEADGRRLSEVMTERGAEMERSKGSERYRFTDGSSIIVEDGGWDLGFDDAPEHCYCWSGNHQHQEKCEEETRRRRQEPIIAGRRAECAECGAEGVHVDTDAGEIVMACEVVASVEGETLLLVDAKGRLLCDDCAEPGA
jgi:hypothetical protein